MREEMSWWTLHRWVKDRVDSGSGVVRDCDANALWARIRSVVYIVYMESFCVREGSGRGYKSLKCGWRGVTIMDPSKETRTGARTAAK